jgi:hypothetical protein
LRRRRRRRRRRRKKLYLLSKRRRKKGFIRDSEKQRRHKSDIERNCATAATLPGSCGAHPAVSHPAHPQL